MYLAESFSCTLEGGFYVVCLWWYVPYVVLEQGFLTKGIPCVGKISEVSGGTGTHRLIESEQFEYLAY